VDSYSQAEGAILDSLVSRFRPMWQTLRTAIMCSIAFTALLAAVIDFDVFNEEYPQNRQQESRPPPPRGFPAQIAQPHFSVASSSQFVYSRTTYRLCPPCSLFSICLLHIYFFSCNTNLARSIFIGAARNLPSTIH